MIKSLGNFYEGKNVFVTGHTGFKGSWLSLWLHFLGAKVTGYALDPPTRPNLFELCKLDKLINSIICDVRDLDSLKKSMLETKPDIVIHMAAQPLVRESYRNPVETYSINVMGTVNLIEATRNCNSIRAILNVTSDKCYENKDWCWGYRENEPLGGFDPYSNSKACSELITLSYKDSFFNEMDYETHGVCLASARAGNVIGGGDWGIDRLFPDCIRAFLNGENVVIRYPNAVRPWQHVFEPISGYLLLIQKMYENGPKYAGGWNFGPNDYDAKTVEWVIKEICTKWGEGASYEIDKDCGKNFHEANYLKLDCSKAKSLLNWCPKWTLAQAIDCVIEWTKAYKERQNVKEVCLMQIKEYMYDKD